MKTQDKNFSIIKKTVNFLIEIKNLVVSSLNDRKNVNPCTFLSHWNKCNESQVWNNCFPPELNSRVHPTKTGMCGRGWMLQEQTPLWAPAAVCAQLTWSQVLCTARTCQGLHHSPRGCSTATALGDIPRLEWLSSSQGTTQSHFSFAHLLQWLVVHTQLSKYYVEEKGDM